MPDDSQNSPELTDPTSWWTPTEIRERFEGLTENQRHVLRAITFGESNIQIAHRLGVTEKSVERHISRLCAKLNVPHRTKAAVFYTLWSVQQTKEGDFPT